MLRFFFAALLIRHFSQLTVIRKITGFFFQSLSFRLFCKKLKNHASFSCVYLFDSMADSL